jgi:hypothetical protein
MKLPINPLTIAIIIFLNLECAVKSQSIPDEFLNPPREFSVTPFWFWNDTLKDEVIVNQIADFEAHGVYGFVIHPRIGLPAGTGWLSPEMIHAMHVAIEEAARRKMHVVLYDEGMYPSGSSAGQVVARNPAHAARGFAKTDLKNDEIPKLAPGEILVTIIDRPGGNRIAVTERPSGGVIRGLHYLGEGTGKLTEESPPAGDILNPDAVTSFIELVYERYANEFGIYFGNVITGIFTDEPSPLGRGSEKGMFPGNAKLLERINRIVGYNFRPYLADLWYNDSPASAKHRNDYLRAINICLGENYFSRLGNWCREHGISLMGHPAGSMDIGAEQYFQVPGQDLVWRYVEPGPKALEGEHSTMAKCASSAMIHLGLRRNSNELYGAYGHNLTRDEMEWLANWCFVRGQNLLFPHAFYYSVRGPRFDERPPDVGPHAPWWYGYKKFADACSRLSWLNTDSHHICGLAMLCEEAWLPDGPAGICYRNQHDFNYLEIRHLWEDARTNRKGVHIAGMNYSAIILDSLSYIPRKAKPVLKKLARNGRLLIRNDSGFKSMFRGATICKTPGELIDATDRLLLPDLILTAHSDNIRCRHVTKGGDNYYILFNEESSEVNTGFKIPVRGTLQLLDPYAGRSDAISENEIIHFRPHEIKILRVITSFKLPPI